MIKLKPKWRNGRRGGLKNRCPNGHVSSTLTFGTIRYKYLKSVGVINE